MVRLLRARLVQRLEAHRNVALLLALALSALLVWLDREAGLYLAFPVAFLLPVVLLAWFRGAAWALALSAVLVAIRAGFALRWLESQTAGEIVANAGIRLLVFAAIAYVAGALAESYRAVRHAEERARLSEQRFRHESELLALAEQAAGAGTWNWDMVSGQLEWSPQLFRLFGLDPAADAATFDAWRRAVHPDDLPEAERRLAAAVEQREFYNDSYRIRRPDGKARWLQTLGAVSCDEADRPVRMAGLCVDVTDVEDLRESRDRLVAINMELVKAARLKDEFLATMRHELRTPLTAILGLTEALQERAPGPLGESEQEALRTIDASGRRLLALLNDILDFATAEAGQLQLHLDTVLLANACAGSLSLVRGLARAKEIALEERLDDPGATIEADPKRLKQMLVNLLGNAVKFTPRGGRVTLETTTRTEDGLVRFAVEDTGIGIPPESVAQLFKPFTQLDGSLIRAHEGTGMGLALVRCLAELHGGTVTVESEPGKGSRFTLSLPVHPPCAMVG